MQATAGATSMFFSPEDIQTGNWKKIYDDKISEILVSHGKLLVVKKPQEPVITQTSLALFYFELAVLPFVAERRMRGAIYVL